MAGQTVQEDENFVLSRAEIFKISAYRLDFTLINIQIARYISFTSGYRKFRVIELRVNESRL